MRIYVKSLMKLSFVSHFNWESKNLFGPLDAIHSLAGKKGKMALFLCRVDGGGER